MKKIALIVSIATGRSVSQNYKEAFGWFRKAVAQGYPLSINLDKGWSMGYYARVPNDYILIELIKQGDNINKWKELLTIQIFAGHRGGNSLEEMFDNLGALREIQCPGFIKCIPTSGANG